MILELMAINAAILNRIIIYFVVETKLEDYFLSKRKTTRRKEQEKENKEEKEEVVVR